MRVYASLGALASIARLSSAAAVPQAEAWGAFSDTTCTTTTAGQATVIVLPGQSAASYTAPSVFTFTLPANGGPESPGGSAQTLSDSLGSSTGLANGPSIVSSTCTSSETPLIPGSIAGLSGLVTVTVPGLPTPSAPEVSTVTVPVLTVTLPSPALSPDSSIVTVTVTVQPSSSGLGSEDTATPVVTATVPGVAPSNSVGVVTVTIPEGKSDTATAVLTVTVPQGSGSPGAWSTIITAPALSGASTGPLVTVTIFTSPATAVSAGPSTPLDWSSESTAFITIPLDTGYGSDISLAPYTLTYTLPLAPGLTGVSTATVTVTPLDASTPTGVGPFATATLSAGVSSWSYVPSPPGTSVVSFTVSASGTVPAYTGVITVTPGMSWGLPTPVITGPPSVVTVTETPSSPAQSEPGIVAVTYTAPASLGVPASEYTVTYTLSPSDSLASETGPTPWTFTIIPTDGSGTPMVVTFTPSPTDVSAWTSVQPDVATVTVTPGAAQSSDIVSGSSGVVTVTYTPSATSSDSGVIVTTITPLSGSPIVITLPGTGSPLTPPTPTSWTTQTAAAPGESIVTVSPVSGAPFVVTITPDSDASTATTSGAGVVTITHALSDLVTETIISDSVITVTPPSGPPFVVTIPDSVTPTGTFNTGSGGSIFTVTPSSGSPVVITFPGGSGLFSLSTNSPSLSVLTITPASGSPIVVTLPADSTSTPSSSGVFVTPSPATYTIADSYGNPTTLTQWTYLPVSPSDSSAGAGAGLSGALGSSTGTVQFTTILPSASVSVITILPSAAPSVITIWPSTNSLLASFLSSTSCTDEHPGATNTADPNQAQSDSASQSEITLWPLPTSIDTTCMTFSTSYRSSLSSDPGAATPASSFSVITLWPSTSSSPYSVITIWPSSDDSALAGWPATSTCTETPAVLTSVILLSSVSSPFTPFTTFPTPSTSQGGESSVPTEMTEAPVSQGLDTSASALPENTELPPSQPENTELPASQPESTESPPAQPENTEAPVNASEDLMPPPQTEFNRHGQHERTTAIQSDSSFGGYAFSSSADGYGNLPPGYGNPVATASAFSSEPIFFTEPNLPISQPASVTISDVSITATFLPVSTTSSADLTSLLSSIMSALSANATIVSGSGPVLTSIDAASSNNTLFTQPSIRSSSSDLLLTSDSIVPTLTALPTTTRSPPSATLSSRSPENITSSSTSSRGLPASTCGAVGDRGAVVFKFDDIPTISTDNDTEASSFPAMPVPFPYHRFFFSNGFSIVPPPRTKFKPSSGEQLIQHNSSVSPVAEFGLAQLRSNPCFHFSFLGVSLGCDSMSDPCVFNITGLRWNGTEDVVEARHTFEVAACSEKTDCSLSHQILGSAAELPFSNLTSLNISLTVAGKPETWWADDLQIAWANNDCTAAACRSRVPNTIMIPHQAQALTNRAKRLLRWAVRGNDNELY
ncbi:hypothetical protein QBC36DRAFT_195015 [Triangularia setosa]|uniref:DUF7371 domain-containing protein n=1 Tax=Triangularia setosa TaxID=2587417 RepID=A0AAN6W1A0_9PEZI|nr:hypothetical protein QBC36DRAFT_195015 [Podospora setosa]